MTPARDLAGPSRSDCDVVIVGGGILGMATAYALRAARPGLEVVVLEKERHLASHQSGSNSGVIHSGVYYRPGSLKARLAVRGQAELVDFCARHGIPHAVPGKLIVATEEAELPALRELARRAGRNGVPVTELTPAEVAAREPGVRRARAGLYVATTGLADFRAVTRALADAADAFVAQGTKVVGIERRPGQGVAVRTAPGGHVLRARALVNCAGLHADRVALLAGDEPGLRIVPFRGEFYRLRRERAGLVRGLVYPVPDPAFPFLGVHLTAGLDGEVRIGPNAVLALAREGYRWRRVSARELAGTLAYRGAWRMARRHWRAGAGELRRSLSKRAFAGAVRRLLPDVSAGDLLRAPAGVRAQAVTPDGALVDDFRFARGPHTVHVLNAPSPAATACLPIGGEVARRVVSALEDR